MEKALLTSAVPFDKDVFFSKTTPLFVITSKKTDDDIITHVESHRGYEGMTKRSDTCVARVIDFESHRQLYVLDALDTSSIRSFLERQDMPELFQNPDATYKYLRELCRTYKQGHKMVYKVDIINGILVFRMYYFWPNFFDKDRAEGYHEITRICFKGDECWKENRDGKRYNYDPQYAYFKCTRETICDRIGSHKDFLRTLGQVYPKAAKHCSSFRDFLVYFNSMYKGDVVYKNTPDTIVEHLQKTYRKNEDEIPRRESNHDMDLFDDDEDIPFDNGILKAIDVAPDVLCYLFFDDEGVNTERVYFTKDKAYRFGYNNQRNCWVSTRKLKMRIMPVYIPYDKKTNTILDYYGNMFLNERATFAQVFMAIDSPLIEKLYKMGLKRVIQPYYGRSTETNVVRTTQVLKLIAQNMNIPYNRKEMDAMEPYQLFGISRGQMKYISRETIGGGDIFSFRAIMTHPKTLKIYPDIQKRIEFAQLFLQRYTPTDLDNMEVEKVKFLGKVASSAHTHAERSRILNHYLDYLRLREDAILYNEYLERLNEQDGMKRETFKYELYPKVSRINFLHDKASRDASYYRQVKDKEKLAIQDKHIKEFVTSHEYTKFLYENDMFTLCAPMDTQSLIYEGNFLSHCVGTYASSVASKRSYIYFLRKKDDVDTPYFTMEVVKGGTSGYELRQCYTFHDTIDKSKACKRFIEDWCEAKKIRIRCSI